MLPPTSLHVAMQPLFSLSGWLEVGFLCWYAEFKSQPDAYRLAFDDTLPTSKAFKFHPVTTEF